MHAGGQLALYTCISPLIAVAPTPPVAVFPMLAAGLQCGCHPQHAHPCVITHHRPVARKLRSGVKHRPQTAFVSCGVGRKSDGYRYSTGYCTVQLYRYSRCLARGRDTSRRLQYCTVQTVLKLLNLWRPAWRGDRKIDHVAGKISSSSWGYLGMNLNIGQDTRAGKVLGYPRNRTDVSVVSTNDCVSDCVLEITHRWSVC